MGFKVSQTELAVDKCAWCQKKLLDVVIDAPIIDGGPWAYLCILCSQLRGNKSIGTIHRNIPA